MTLTRICAMCMLLAGLSGCGVARHADLYGLVRSVGHPPGMKSENENITGFLLWAGKAHAEIGLLSDKPSDEVIAYYRERLLANGWKQKETNIHTLEFSRTRGFGARKSFGVTSRDSFVMDGGLTEQKGLRDYTITFESSYWYDGPGVAALNGLEERMGESAQLMGWLIVWM